MHEWSIVYQNCRISPDGKNSLSPQKMFWSLCRQNDATRLQLKLFRFWICLHLFLNLDRKLGHDSFYNRTVVEYKHTWWGTHCFPCNLFSTRLVSQNRTHRKHFKFNMTIKRSDNAVPLYIRDSNNGNGIFLWTRTRTSHVPIHTFWTLTSFKLFAIIYLNAAFEYTFNPRTTAERKSLLTWHSNHGQ